MMIVKLYILNQKQRLKRPTPLKSFQLQSEFLLLALSHFLLDTVSKIVISIDKALVQYEKSTFYTFLPRLFEIQIPNAHKKSAENLASPECIEGIVVANFP